MRRGLKLPAKLLGVATRDMLGTVTGVVTREPVVALTFDDGPHPAYTPRLLEVLGKHQAHATFFVVGKLAARHPDVVRKVAEAGHAIGNHTWDHPSMTLLGRQERRKQLQACALAIEPYGQRLFRPPYGHQGLASWLEARRLGYEVVTWSFHAEDWLDHSADQLTERVSKHLKPGAIVLLHDNLYSTLEPRYFDRSPTVTAVDRLLSRYGGSYRFVTVPELLRHGQARRKLWFKKGDDAWLASLEGRVGGSLFEHGEIGRGG